MVKKAVCDTCGREYTDDGSVQMVQRWLEKDNYAPCSDLSCRGQMQIKDIEPVEPVCTTDECCVYQSTDRTCIRKGTTRCKWAVVGGTIPKDYATCDGCDYGYCESLGSAYEPAE